MTAESCNGGSPWKCSLDTVRAAFSLDRQGVSIVGLPDEKVLEMSNQLNQAIITGKAEALIRAWQKEQRASHQA